RVKYNQRPSRETPGHPSVPASLVRRISWPAPPYANGTRQTCSAPVARAKAIMPVLAADGSLSLASPDVIDRGAAVGRPLVGESGSTHSAIMGPRAALKSTSPPSQDLMGGVCTSILCDRSSINAPESMALPPSAGITHQSVQVDRADVFA